jgi:hypothetical protein
MRHIREKHQPGFECMRHDCDYKWSRKYEYRKHLREKHRLEDDKIDRILGPPRRHGRRAIERDAPPHFSPPIEPDRQSLAKPQQRPLMLPVLAVGKDVHHASPHLVPSSLAYNPRVEHAESEITTIRHEDSSGLEHLAVTHAPSRLLPNGDFALLEGYYKTHGLFRLVHTFLCATYVIDSALRFPSAHPGGSTTASIPPSPGMLHIPALPSPVGVYHTTTVSGDPPSLPWADAASTLTNASSWWGQLEI